MNITRIAPLVSRVPSVSRGRTSVSHAALLGALVLLAGCSTDAPMGLNPSAVRAVKADDKKVDVCHIPSGEGGNLLEVSINALRAHLTHGDYIAGLDVDKQNTVGDGVHFTRITDALNAARATRRQFQEKMDAACRITITVGPGTFTGAFTASTDATLELFPLLLNVPDVTLQGGLRLQIVGGRATKYGLSDADVTTLAPNRALVNTPKPEAMIIATYTADGYVGHGVTIDGFAFASGRPAGSTVNGGFGILSMEVTDFVISNNRFATALTTAIDLRATSARIERNYAEGLGTSCGFCLGGPGNVEVTGNTIVNGIRVGILVIPVVLVPVPAGVVQYVPRPTETITATLTNNSVTDHTRHVPGFATAVRIVAAGVAGVAHSSVVTLTGNDLLRNSFGVMFDGGSSGPNVRGDAVVTLNGNTILQSCRRDLLVSFASPNRALGASPTAPYLVNSTFTLSRGGDVADARTWFDHPAGYGNTLIVDGSPMGNTTPLPVLVPTAPCS